MVGLDNLKKCLEELNNNKHVYQWSDIRFNNFLISMERGNGYSFITDYVTDYLYDNKLISFAELDKSMEYKLNGTYKQLVDVFLDIKERAVYTNRFEGLISIDITDLALYINESQTDYFFEQYEKLSEAATVLLFIDRTKGGKYERLYSLMLEKITNIDVFEIENYSENELAEITFEKLEDMGIATDDREALIEAIKELMPNMGNIRLAKDTINLAKQIAMKADYSKFVPFISKDDIKKLSVSKLRKELVI